jgi:hypothetical protein
VSEPLRATGFRCRRLRLEQATHSCILAVDGTAESRQLMWPRMSPVGGDSAAG